MSSDRTNIAVHRPEVDERKHAGPVQWPLSWIEARSKAIGLQRLDLVLPSGRCVELGVGSATPPAVRLVRWSALFKMLRRGALGFAEAYIEGDVDCDDLVTLFNYFMRNEPALLAVAPRFNKTRRSDRAYHRRRPNTHSGSRRNIAAHYDLGNAFYRSWLDATMLYSSGIYRSPGDTLEMAQHEKLRVILSALQLAPEMRLLEIGCGWGAVAVAAASDGARVRAITISSEQQHWAQKAVVDANLSDRAEIVFEDYRDTGDSFDRVVSIEMIEAVGEANWPVYYKTLHDRLRAGGHAVIQAITIAPNLFEGYRRNPDFIQRYVFPGGMLPTVAHIRTGAASAGLHFECVEEFGPSYARTLSDWRVRFEASWPAIKALGYDERFRRLWLFYLAYCEVGFSLGTVNVGLYRLSKPAAR